MLELPKGLRMLVHLVRGAALLGAVILVIGYFWFWTNPEMVLQVAPDMTGMSADKLVVDNRARWLGALGAVPPGAVTLFGLWQLWQLFGQYGVGQFFAPGTQTHLRRFAWALLLATVLQPLELTWLGLAYTLGNPPGKHVLHIGISSDLLLPLLTSAALLAIAFVLSEASRIAEENGQFV